MFFSSTSSDGCSGLWSDTSALPFFHPLILYLSSVLINSLFSSVFDVLLSNVHSFSAKWINFSHMVFEASSLGTFWFDLFAVNVLSSLFFHRGETAGRCWWDCCFWCFPSFLPVTCSLGLDLSWLKGFSTCRGECVSLVITNCTALHLMFVCFKKTNDIFLWRWFALV